MLQAALVVAKAVRRMVPRAAWSRSRQEGPDPRELVLSPSCPDHTSMPVPPVTPISFVQVSASDRPASVKSHG